MLINVGTITRNVIKQNYSNYNNCYVKHYIKNI